MRAVSPQFEDKIVRCNPTKKSPKSENEDKRMKDKSMKDDSDDEDDGNIFSILL